MTPPNSTITNILIFETNIRYKKDVTKVAAYIAADGRIKRWTVDREDCSRVLRIESQNLDPNEVITLINQAGFSCAELPD